MADGTKGTPFCFVSTKMQFKPHEVYSCTHTKGQNFLGKEGGAILVRLLQQEGSRPPAPLGVGVTVWPLWKSALLPPVAHMFLLRDELSETQSPPQKCVPRHRDTCRRMSGSRLQTTRTSVWGRTDLSPKVRSTGR